MGEQTRETSTNSRDHVEKFIGGGVGDADVEVASELDDAGSGVDSADAV